MLTQELLKQYLFYDPETGTFTWAKNRRGVNARVGNIAGRKNKNHNDGYLVITILGKSYKGHRLAWLYVYGQFPEVDVDHINGNRGDNKISNLRLATRADNCRNRKTRKDSGTGSKNVQFRYGKWKVKVCFNYKRIHGGTYETLQEAEAAAMELRNRLHGKYASSGA